MRWGFNVTNTHTHIHTHKICEARHALSEINIDLRLDPFQQKTLSLMRWGFDVTTHTHTHTHT